MAAPAFVLAEAHEQFVIMIADIAALAPRLLPPVVAARALRPFDGDAALEPDAVGQQEAELRQVGRAACREGVCPYVSIPGVAVALKKKHRTKGTPAHRKA